MGYNISLAVSVNRLTHDRIHTVRVICFNILLNCLVRPGAAFFFSSVLWRMLFHHQTGLNFSFRRSASTRFSGY